MDVIELANHLRLEHLFITTEKQQLQNLNEKFIKCTEDVFHTSWVTQKQKSNLYKLLHQDEDCLQSNSIMVSNSIENVVFVDSYKKLSTHAQIFSDLLSQLRKKPKVIAMCLIELEQHYQQSDLESISSAIFSSLYCDCILPEDQQLALLLLKELFNLQLSVSDNPLKLIKNGNCSFKIFFKLFIENLVTCKFYLSAALKDAIFNCLMEDELYLDLDPERAAMQYNEEERQRLFGLSSDKENYFKKLSKFKQNVTEKLNVLVINFLEGIQSSFNCFPSLLFSLFKHVYQKFIFSKKIDDKQASMVCTDLIFGQFICHAIVNPDLYGIVDSNITKMAKFNLTQIAQIMQVLALSNLQEFDAKLNEFVSKIPIHYLNNTIQCFTQNEIKNDSINNQLNMNTHNVSSISNEMKRTCILFSENDLSKFIKMLILIKNETFNQYLKKNLENLLRFVSETFLEKLFNSNNTMNQFNDKVLNSEDSINIIETNNNLNLTTKMNSSKKSILDKMTRRNKTQDNNDSTDHKDDHKEDDNQKANKRSLLNKVNKKSKFINSADLNEQSNSNKIEKNKFQFIKNSKNFFSKDSFQILVIPILNVNNLLYNDILSEEEVLNIDFLKKNKIKLKSNLEFNNILSNNQVSNSNSQQSQNNLNANSLNHFSFCEIEDKTFSLNVNNVIDNKRSKFNSLSQDQESIETNDNLEVISEASSIENLNENLLIEGDNLSDMISANVSSGRATPNVSERDSSSSSSSSNSFSSSRNDNDENLIQVNDNNFHDENQIINEQNNDNLNINNIILNNNQISPLRINNSNNVIRHEVRTNAQRTQDYIEEKFGKFDYKQKVVQPIDETKSLLSDTWSTDVLASLSSISMISSQLNDITLTNQVSETLNYDCCKKILRQVFSTIDIQNVPIHNFLSSKNAVNSSSSNSISNKLNDLQNLLRLLLTEAKYMQNLTNSIALQEALRYLNNFDENLLNKMLQDLKNDYQKRSSYVAYLVKCKQNLISAIKHFQTIKCYLNQDKNVISNCLITFYVRKFFMQRLTKIDTFLTTFKHLSLADEKAHLVEEFLNELYIEMEQDPDWIYANESQLSYANVVVERIIFSYIYFNAFYPNSDGDIHRDQIFFNHIQSLSKIVTPDHKDLKIPKLHHNECPWPSAQEQLLKLNAYRTPKDKLNCVLNCCSVIMNLLSLCEKSIPAADDFVPVLVYVIIRTNPPSLLSTIDFINTYYESKLEGEQAYWWTQFCSAVAFVKTMDY